MHAPWTTSYLLASALLVHSRLLLHSRQVQPLIKFWITALLTLLTEFSIALAIWSSARIQTRDSTMRAKYGVELERIFSFLKMMLCPDGMGLY